MLLGWGFNLEVRIIRFNIPYSLVFAMLNYAITYLRGRGFRLWGLQQRLSADGSGCGEKVALSLLFTKPQLLNPRHSTPNPP